MLALRAHHLVDLGLHQLVQDTEPDTHAQRQQPFLRGAGQLTERLEHRLGQPLDALFVRRDRRGRYRPHAVGPPVLVDFGFAPITAPRGPDGAGGPPPSSSTSYGTTSALDL